MQNLGLWGDVSHLLQKQHETVIIIIEITIRMINTDTNTESNGSRRNST